MTTQAPEAPAIKADTTPPTPKIDLPEIPFDKSRLEGVTKLDNMITEAAFLRAATEHVNGTFESMKRGSQTSLNGTVTDQVRGLLGIIEGLDAFESGAKVMAIKARKRFQDIYPDDSAFSSLYRATYLAAEEELDRVISDNVKRRATLSAMHNTYKQPPGTNISWLDSMIEESESLRTATIGRVIQSVETDLMVADFKKGQQLVDLLQGSRSKLELIKPLDEDDERVAAALQQIAEKEAARKEEVAAAREAYRMPARFDKSSAPENAEELETSLRKTLEKNGYEVHAVALASEWTAVKSVLGVHLYNQIDFHVAVTSHITSEAEAGVLDVLYVTGKSSGVDLDVPFGSYSAGCVAQMLAVNIDR